METLLITIGIFALGIGILKYIQQSRKRFSPQIKKRIEDHLEAISLLSVKEKIFELDKALDECLREKGFTGSLGEKMKQYGKGFVNENAIWQAHKLRNAITHEIGFSPQIEEADSAIYAFMIEITTIIGE